MSSILGFFFPSLHHEVERPIRNTIDELLRSDEELKKKVINDSRQLAYPKLKEFDIVFLNGGRSFGD